MLHQEFLAEIRQSELRAEAARERIARSARTTGRPSAVASLAASLAGRLRAIRRTNRPEQVRKTSVA